MDKVVLFVNIVPWRPHDDHAAFLAKQFTASGWVAKAAYCGGGFKHCYQKMMNSRPFECGICRAGSLERYSVFDKVLSISRSSDPQTEKAENEVNWSVLSSISNSRRHELDDHVTRSDHADLVRRTNDEYRAQVAKWESLIVASGAELVFVFNGRFHDSHAVLEACSRLNLDFYTHERTWFGYGIHIVKNNDCISLDYMHSKLEHASKVPLDRIQCHAAFTLIRNRIFGSKSGEWRSYGQSLTNADLEKPARKSLILIVPSSRSEFVQHPDYVSDFPSQIEAIEYFIDKHDLAGREIVVRAHPAWCVKTGNYKVSQSHYEYSKWAALRGFAYVEPDSPESTYALMGKADFAIFNGGSAVVEAVLLGCRCVSVSPAPYQMSGFVTDLSNKEKIDQFTFNFIDQQTAVVKALRYVHARAISLPYFTKTVRPITGISHEIYDDQDYNQLELSRLLGQSIETPEGRTEELSMAEEELLDQIRVSGVGVVANEVNDLLACQNDEFPSLDQYWSPSNASRLKLFLKGIFRIGSNIGC